MVGGDVVRDEVEDQPEAVTRWRLACEGEPVRPAEAGVHRVVADAVRRADDVGRREVGQRAPKALHQRPVLEGDRDPGRASLPDAHQPDGVEPERCQPFPLRVRHARKIDRPARPWLSSSSHVHVLIS